MSAREWDQSEIESGSFKWSLMTDTDRQTIKVIVDIVCVTWPLINNTLSFLEIGTYNASTAWGVRKLVEARGKTLDYWGIDTMSHDAVLWPGAHMIIGDSTKIFYQVPNLPFDILFIDGPHFTTNCMLDFLNYAPKVKIGGLILFHDASPASQTKLPFTPDKVAEYERGGFEIPIHNEFGTAVTIALEKLGLSTGSRTDYALVSNNWSWEPYGGISIYKKLR
jgi:hypothetical protein